MICAKYSTAINGMSSAWPLMFVLGHHC